MIFFLKDTGPNLTSEEGVWGAVTKAARSLFYMLNELIYKTITDLYTLFEYLCNARLLDSETLQKLATKVGLILGMIMLFNVIFNFIRILLEPDKMNDKEMGAIAIVKKCLLVIVMLGVSSFFFDTLYRIQQYVIHEKVIYKLILPGDQMPDTDNFGAVLAARTFGTFYYVNNTFLTSGADDADTCDQYRNLLINRIALNNDFSVGNYCLNAWDEIDIPIDGSNQTTQTFSAFIMDYNFILQFLVGVAIVYLLLMYAIKVGVRVIQLTVLQIISPMAIVSYLSPKKDNMFSKWWKIYFSTYIDAFIRIAIIYFVIYLSSILLDTMESGEGIFWASIGDPENSYTRGVFTITMILALLTFAKKAPDLIKELLPASASKLGFGVNSKDIFGLNALVAGAAGYGIGTIGRVPGALANTGRAIGMIKRDVSSADGFGKVGAFFKGTGRAIGTSIGSTAGVAFGGVSGAIRGGYAGFGAKGGMLSAAKAGQQAQAKANLARSKRQLAGGHWYDGIPDAINNFNGNVSGYERLEAANTSYSNLKSEIDNDDKVKNAQTAYNARLSQWVEAGGTAEEFEISEVGERYEKAIKDARKAVYAAKMGTGQDKDEVFQEKVKMHNRRFGTGYNARTDWTTINNDRKAIKKEFEMAQAQKPQK